MAAIPQNGQEKLSCPDVVSNNDTDLLIPEILDMMVKKKALGKPYRLIDHTADLGILVFGATVKALYENAAHAMFELITDSPLAIKISEDVRIEGKDRPDLMVNWLRELLYLWTGKEQLVAAVEIRTLSETELFAVVWTEPFDPGRHQIRNELKAVTYHQIRVDRTDDGWESQVIFDV